MKVKIDIDTGTFVRFLLVVSAFGAVVFLLWKLLPVLLILTISFFLAIALNRPVSALARWLPGQSRVLATAISYIVFISLLSLFLVVAVPPIIKQTNVFINSLPAYIQQVSEQRGVIGEVVDRYQLESEVESFIKGAQAQAGQLAQGLGSNVVAGVSTFINGLITILTVLVLTFLMLIEGPLWVRRLWDSYHDPKLLERHRRLITRMYRVVTGYVNGQLLVASIAASAAALTLLVLSTFFTVPVSAILPLAVIVFFTSMIPMIGASIGAAIVLTVLAFSDIGAALIFVIYFIVYQQIENNVIQPTVQSRSVELSALGIFTAAIVGIVSFGLLGGVLAIPVAGCIRVLLLDYVDNRRAQRESHRRMVKAKA